jgi:hypothetical protein
MNVTLLKALLVLVPGVLLLIGSIALYRHHKTKGALLQVLGSGSLIMVVLTHVSEALHALPSMGWGQQNSPGQLHRPVAATLIPTGYLLHALRKRF